uniref:RNA helicase n=1 Tax=Neogobius melanostomus TaxID=47308 RepID=A0A8C6SEN0_9GOBI
MAAAGTQRKRLLKDEDMTKVEFETSEEVDVTPTFDTMGLREDLLRGIYAYGFEKPSAIQQRAIKQIIKGRDVIVSVRNWKTATFCISVLQCLDIQVSLSLFSEIYPGSHSNMSVWLPGLSHAYSFTLT